MKRIAAGFLGRGRTPSNPIAVMEDRPLSNTTGAVLDPVFSLRGACGFRRTKREVLVQHAVARSREEAMALADKYHDPNIFEREQRLAWTKAQVEMSHLGIDSEEAHLFQRLAARIIYSDPSLRPTPHVLAMNTKAQSSLWAYGISGDLPIVGRSNQQGRRSSHRQKTRARSRVPALQRTNGRSRNTQRHADGLLAVAARGIGNDHPHQRLARSSGQARRCLPAACRPHARRRSHPAPRGRARRDRCGSRQFRRPDRTPRIEEPLPPLLVRACPSQIYPESHGRASELSFFNGLGGFHQGGREYVTTLGAEQWTPAPWSNVVGNAVSLVFRSLKPAAVTRGP
jgi:cyclic beta-1,2-glucan synthetase